MQEERLRQSFRRVAGVLDTLNVNWFLEGGSCLGYVRDGCPIAWDLDIDIGIYDSNFDFPMLSKRLAIDVLLGFGTTVAEARIHWPLRVDVFRFFDYRGLVAEALFNIKATSEAKFLLYPKEIFEAGIERVDFCGVECNALQRSHDYCRTLYGDSYLVPDPHYHWWDGPRNGVLVELQGIFERESIRSHVYRIWRSEGPASVLQKGLRHIGRKTAALVTRLGAKE
jgi:hypothetical protein